MQQTRILQSCTATGQSNLADRMEDCSTGQSAVRAKVQLWENQAFVAGSSLHAKFNCPVVCQNFSLLATVHDCETGLLRMYSILWKSTL